MKKLACTILLLTTIALFAFADKQGELLAQKYFERPEADSSSGESKLVVIDSKGNKRSKELLQYSKKDGKVDKSYAEFISPADVEGTKFLTLSEPGKDDEQRLFLPALGKVRRIANTDKGSSFMGTDLYYYDLESHNMDDFKDFKDLGADTVNKIQVNKLEMTPIDKNAPYSKQILYLNTETNFPVMIECYDQEGKLLKKIINLKNKTFDGGIIMPIQVVVDNVQEKQKTLMAVKNIKINEKISDKYFSIQNLTQ